MSDDEWLDFRKRFNKFGIEPSDDLIDLLETISGISKPISIRYEEIPRTCIDPFLDKVENGWERVQNKIKQKKLLHSNNKLKLLK